MTLIVAFEGIDGSGKTLQSNLLRDALNNRGLSVLTRDYPRYASFIGRQIGQILTAKDSIDVDPKSMSLWYAVDRLVDLNGQIRSEIGIKDVIIFNRYTLSSAVYQGSRASTAYPMMEWVFDLEQNVLGLPKPNITFVLALTVSEALERNKEKANRTYISEGADNYERDLELQSKAAQLYEEYCSSRSDYVLVQPTKNGKVRTASSISAEILSEVERRL